MDFIEHKKAQTDRKNPTTDFNATHSLAEMH